MNDRLYSITFWHVDISPPPPKKKKNSAIKQMLTEKWNTLGVTKPLLTSSNSYFALFASFWRKSQSHPRDPIPSCWLSQIHTWNCMLRYFFFLVMFKTDVSHPPHWKQQRVIARPFLSISSHHHLPQVVGSWEKPWLKSQQANHTHQW